MNRENFEISKLFDSTLLNSDTSLEKVVQFVKQSVEYDVRAVVIPWCYIPIASKLIEETTVGLVVGIDFPLGYSPIEMKLEEIDYYSRSYPQVTDFDVMVNHCAIKSRDWDFFRREVEQIAKFIKKKEKVCKIILEVTRLSQDELLKSCQIIANVDGIDYVKTGTGFGPRPVSYEDVLLIKRVLDGKKKIKVAGGVRTVEQVRQFLKLGVDLFGSSHALEIIREMKGERRDV